MATEHRPEFDQPGNRELGRANRDTSADRAVRHPRRKLTRHAWDDLDVENLPAAAAVPRVEPDTLPMQRVPWVKHDDELRTVCRMTWGVDR
jgi:hypothetical protein